MGCYLNPPSDGFRQSLNSQIYVDKTGLIAQTNAHINTQQRFLCVSRPRRFGKSMAADMLAAYYGCGEDARALFSGLKIADSPSCEAHLNRYNVLKINMQEFLSMTHNVDEMLTMLKSELIRELCGAYPHARSAQLVWAMKDVYAESGRSFIILIDEWDCLFREFGSDAASQKKYLDFLRLWMKDQTYVGLAYMTGILPIKKYGTHSALNMFMEYSMTDPGELAEFFGFTEDEVRALCVEYSMSFEETKAWYDGYELIGQRRDAETAYAMYSPKSVVEAMLRHRYNAYWNQTETYEALKTYIQMNYDGLKDAVVRMLAGERIPINTGTFANDMTTFAGRDDVLTLLAHLGYLNYDSRTGSVSIPNKEVSQEYVNAISAMEGWSEVTRSVKASKELLESLWSMDAEAVAKALDRAHEEISILKYNDENSLSCAIHLAFYFAKEYYTVIRELPTGKGFADVCLIPRRRYADKPAVIIELKKDQSAKGAIDQIKERRYVSALADYKGNLLLCGINYDSRKKHACMIEKTAL